MYLTLLWLLSLRCWRWLNLTLPSLLLSRRWRGRLHLTLLLRWLHLTLFALLRWRRLHLTRLTLPRWRGRRLHLTLLTLLWRWRRWLHLTLLWRARSLWRLFLLFLFRLRRLGDHKYAIESRGVC